MGLFYFGYDFIHKVGSMFSKNTGTYIVKYIIFNSVSVSFSTTRKCACNIIVFNFYMTKGITHYLRLRLFLVFILYICFAQEIISCHITKIYFLVLQISYDRLDDYNTIKGAIL